MVRIITSSIRPWTATGSYTNSCRNYHKYTLKNIHDIRKHIPIIFQFFLNMPEKSQNKKIILYVIIKILQNISKCRIFIFMIKIIIFFYVCWRNHVAAKLTGEQKHYITLLNELAIASLSNVTSVITVYFVSIIVWWKKKHFLHFIHYLKFLALSLFCKFLIHIKKKKYFFLRNWS